MARFKPLGWTCDIAENGEKALEMVREAKFDYKGKLYSRMLFCFAFYKE